MLGTGQTGVAGIINLGFSKLLLNNLVDLVGLRTHNPISSLLQLHWELIPPPQAVAGSGRGGAWPTGASRRWLPPGVLQDHDSDRRYCINLR